MLQYSICYYVSLTEKNVISLKLTGCKRYLGKQGNYAIISNC